MIFSRFSAALSVASCYLLLSNAYAVTQVSNEKTDITLVVKPIACFVQSQGQQCKLTITATWQAPTPVNLCLYQQKQQVQCWRNAQSGFKKFNIKLVESTTFSLINSAHERVATVDVIINAVNPTRYRRRLRADWSVF